MRQNDNDKAQSNRLTETLKEEIRKEFVTGVSNESGVFEYPSIDALVIKYQVSRATLYRHASKEDWQTQRNQAQTELDEEIRQQRLKEFVDHSNRLDDNALRLAQSLLSKVARKMRDDEILIDQDPDYDGMTPSSLDRLASVVAQAQKIGKLALGEAQEISKVSANVAIPESFREIAHELDEIAASKSASGNHTLQ